MRTLLASGRAPLLAAGFTTAFGAHAVAANLAGTADDATSSLLTLGLLLAVYDGAEVVLKPVFGSLADRVGARPVLLGGLLGFAAASALFLTGDGVAWLWAARLGQGAAASAFSPAASALVSRLSDPRAQGRAFGSYGFAKTAGYTLGPLLGGALVWAGGGQLLFACLSLLGLSVAGWAWLSVPSLAPLPRPRQTLADLARRMGSPWFVRPTLALAGGTALLSVGVGFWPVVGRSLGLGPVGTGCVVTLLALTAAVVQPRAGRALDERRLGTRALGAGLLLGGSALGVAAAATTLRPEWGIGALAVAAVLAGIGVGLVTPLGFALVARAAPAERLGQTMGAAEVGRELGDAGGPLLVGAVAAAAGLAAGLGTLAVVLVVLAGAVAALRRDARRASTG